MFKNHAKVALRNLLRHKSYTFINVAGLAVGIACCLLILLYVLQEISYDRHYPDADQVYRVVLEQKRPGGSSASAKTPRSVFNALVSEFPEVAHATRLSKEHADRVLVSYGEKRFFENRVVFADSTFFDVFAVPLVQGNPKSVLTDPYSVVITESTAKKYFDHEDPIGKSLTFRMRGDRDFFDYQIVGVAKDLPRTSHFRFDLLASYQLHPFTLRDGRQRPSWLGPNVYTYVVLRKEALAADLESKLPAMVKQYVAPGIEADLGISYEQFLEDGNYVNYALQPLTDIHLRSDLRNEFQPNGKITYVYLFSAIALFILLLACINFMNLATARSAGRFKEVGVRKVLGSHRVQLVRQFLTESMFLTLLALILALFIVELLLPIFNELVGTHLETNYLRPWFFLPGLIAFAALVGVSAGTYPAFLLSGFAPASALSGQSSTGKNLRSSLRNALVVFQFAVSVALMIGTFVIYRQMDYMLNKKLGFAKEQVVVLEGTEVLGPPVETFRQELAQHPGVVAVAHSETVPGRPSRSTSIKLAGTAETERVPVWSMFAGFDYAKTLGLELLAGRDLSLDFPTDSLGVLLNEAAVQRLGLEEPLGARVAWNDTVYHVIGVVRNFHFGSLHEEIAPLAIMGPDPEYMNRPRTLVSVRIKTDQIRSMLTTLEETWNAFVPQQPFRYSFLDDDFDALYKVEQRTGRIVAIFSALAILIACLGLFGLSAFTAQQRTKEISIRKVLGASVANLSLLLVKKFTTLVAIAFALAAPLAYYATELWLQDFAYRAEFSPLTLVLAGGVALITAFMTICFQSIKAALTNPVDTLRIDP